MASTLKPYTMLRDYVTGRDMPNIGAEENRQGMYGLIRKVGAVEAVPGLAPETLLLTPVVGAYLLWAGADGAGALGRSGRWARGSMRCWSGAA